MAILTTLRRSDKTQNAVEILLVRSAPDFFREDCLTLKITNPGPNRWLWYVAFRAYLSTTDEFFVWPSWLKVSLSLSLTKKLGRVHCGSLKTLSSVMKRHDKVLNVQRSCKLVPPKTGRTFVFLRYQMTVTEISTCYWSEHRSERVTIFSKTDRHHKFKIFKMRTWIML